MASVSILAMRNVIFVVTVVRFGLAASATESSCDSSFARPPWSSLAEKRQFQGQDDDALGLHLLQRGAQQVKSLHAQSASVDVAPHGTSGSDGSDDMHPAGIVGVPVRFFFSGSLVIGMLAFLVVYEAFSTFSGLHVGDRGSSRSAQMLFLLSAFLSTASMTVAFTTVIALTDSSGVQASWCYFFVGVDTAIRLFGVILGRYIANPPVKCRQAIVFSLTMCGLSSLGLVQILESSTLAHSGTLVIAATSLQFSSSFFCGLFYVPIAVQAIRATVSTEITNLQTMVMLCKTLGFVVAPVLGLSSSVAPNPGQVGVVGVLVPLSMLGVTFLVCACCASLFSFRQEFAVKADLQASFDLNSEDRKAIVVTAAVFKVERMFALAAINMATPLILMDGRRWTEVRTDEGTAIALIASILWGLAVTITNWARVPADIHVMRIFSVLGTISVVFFFQFGPVWLLLLVDALTYASAICTVGIAESLAARAAVPSSAYSVENFQMVSECGACLSCACAPFLAQAILANLGRNGYAVLQLILVFTSMAILAKLTIPVRKDWRYAAKDPGSPVPVPETSRL